MSGPPNICTAADRQAWTVLVEAGRTVAAAPTHKGNGRDFHRAHAAAVKAVFPDRSPEGMKPFLTVLGFAKLWPVLPMADQVANATPLSEAAEACAATLGLGGHPPPPPSAPAAAVLARRLPYHDDTFDEDAA